jgi:hypothetical protein
MNWREITFCPTSRTLRQFSVGWLMLFAGFGLHRWLVHGDSHVGVTLLLVGLLLGAAGLVRPALVRWVFTAWMLLALPIGWLISQVSLLIMFYLVITPLALVFKLRHRDALGLKRDSGCPSYWAPVKDSHDIRRYFRQY